MGVKELSNIEGRKVDVWVDNRLQVSYWLAIFHFSFHPRGIPWGRKKERPMRKSITLFFVFLLAGCAPTKVVVKKVNPDQVIHYSQLQKLEKLASLYNTVAYVDKGETIPMEISLDSDFVAFKEKKTSS